jgi:hypothetical protein
MSSKERNQSLKVVKKNWAHQRSYLDRISYERFVNLVVVVSLWYIQQAGGTFQIYRMFTKGPAIFCGIFTTNIACCQSL